MSKDHELLKKYLTIAKGQLEGVIRMIDEDRYCLDIYSFFIEEQYKNGVIGDSRHKTYYTCYGLWDRMERYQGSLWIRMKIHIATGVIAT